MLRFRSALLPCVLACTACGDDGSAGATEVGSGASTSEGSATEGNTSADASSGSESTTSTGTSAGSTTTAGSTAPPITTTTGDGSSGTTTDGPEPGVIYVHFDGGDFSAGNDDASIDQSSILTADTTIAAFEGDESDRVAILATIVTDFAPFAITVTDTRPASGDYTMVVVTPTNVTGIGSVNGVAPLDCGNQNPRNVAFAFSGAITDPELIGSIASGRLGSTFGLENGDEPTDLSYGNAWSPGDDPSWLDSCVDLLFSQECDEQHAAHCPADQQNGFAALTDLFGT